MELVALPTHVTLDDSPKGQFIQCGLCKDFEFLPYSMEEVYWIKRVQDFSFLHDHPK